MAQAGTGACGALLLALPGVHARAVVAYKAAIVLLLPAEPRHDWEGGE